ncbi:unnamed protein product [Arabidopsis arenosa]|uniref:Uncharacterized protein n=1 Tax=Arabidopsis arenosa TaxID=38785 RepID=A0A8S2A8I5_ARAAE|nr:unnamed protein product [Arabidopsis arenosa]
MSGFDCLKLNIKYGVDVSFKDESFAYNGGFEMRDMLMDPDLMTWSIFEDFPKENGVSGPVEKVWYKLAHEDLESVRAIPEDRDSGIRQLCSEALIGGEVDVYIQQGVFEPTMFPMSQPAEHVVVDDNEESDVEVEEDRTAEEARVENDGVDRVEEVRTGDVDPRFSAFYEEINAEVGQETEQDPNAEVGEETHLDPEAEVGHETHQAGDQTKEVAAGQTEEDGEEFERECMDAERPDPAMDTDEEWDAFDREEREISRAKYSKDKTMYIAEVDPKDRWGSTPFVFARSVEILSCTKCLIGNGNREAIIATGADVHIPVGSQILEWISENEVVIEVSE